MNNNSASVDSEALPEAERPQLLSEILSIAKELGVSEHQTFVNFLRGVDDAQRQTFRLQSIFSLKLSFKVLNDDKKQVSAENSSLRIIFDFYAKLAHPGTVMTNYESFDAIDLANTTLEFHEFMYFLRDFKVIPNLITKEDLQFLWKVTSFQWVRMGKPHLTYLDFELTKDFLCRMAILAYNRPGMKRLILNTIGRMPTQVEMVQIFCKYLRIDDFSYIKNKLNNLAKERLKILTGKEDELVGNSVERHKDLDTIRALQAMNRAEKDDYALPDAYESRKQMENMLSEAKNDSKVKKIAKVLQMKMNGVSLEIPQEEHVAHHIKTNRLNHFIVMEGRYHLSEEQEVALLNFDQSVCVRELDKYSLGYTKAVVGENHHFHFAEGSFLDLGKLKPGKLVSITVQLTNNSRDEMQLDVMTRGLPESTTVMLLPRPFAPGLKREAQIQFVTEQEVKDVVGLIELHTESARNGERASLSCPIYYRVRSDGLSVIKDFPRCTIRTLPELLRRYCGRDHIPGVTFMKTRDWYSGPKLMQGPFLLPRPRTGPGAKTSRSLNDNNNINARSHSTCSTTSSVHSSALQLPPATSERRQKHKPLFDNSRLESPSLHSSVLQGLGMTALSNVGDDLLLLPGCHRGLRSAGSKRHALQRLQNIF